MMEMLAIIIKEDNQYNPVTDHYKLFCANKLNRGISTWICWFTDTKYVCQEKRSLVHNNEDAFRLQVDHIYLGINLVYTLWHRSE